MQTSKRALPSSTSRQLTLRPRAILGFFQPKASQANTRTQRKQELLDLVAPLKRGLTATEEDKAAVEAAANALEAVNPTPKPLASPLLSGSWELLYTTSASILGTSRPALLRPAGPIYQVLDAANGKARNIETTPFFNQVSANLVPLSANKVAVQFQEFRIFNLIAFKAPPSAQGELAVTYLDEELRVSRGDKGNLFVLRMADRDAKP
uniref:Plastid lipid-associated protein/fibrillin conserved domain-containing protein n=1 Tax=Chlamydomonas leiostraca TaxID=1034604 RepID=A0A7S0S1G1_9CHLO